MAAPVALMYFHKQYIEELKVDVEAILHAIKVFNAILIIPVFICTYLFAFIQLT